MTYSSFYKSIGSLLVILCFGFNVNAQQVDDHCGMADMTLKLMQKDPLLAGKMAVMEQAVQAYIAKHPVQKGRGIITIPVVVHVINDGEPVGTGSNITDAQVLSQIDVLNLDYRRQNADTFNTPDVFKPVAADMEIQFVMAVRDQYGRPTNGIDRVNGKAATWASNDIDAQLKPKTIWNWEEYLNIWTVNFAANSPLLGYTITPLASNDSIDGVVVGYHYFGNTGNVVDHYNTGRTATHETGHWFGLFHPWGKYLGPGADTCDGVGAGIPDVPDEYAANFGCPSFPHNSCSDSATGGDMYMNYLDYTFDECMNIFTNGQKAYAYSLLNTDTPRIKILTSLAGIRYTYDAAMLNVRLPGAKVCGSSFVPLVQISNEGTSTLTSLTINYNLDNNTNGQFNWTGNLATGLSEFVSLPSMTVPSGAHSLQFYVTYPNNVKDQFSLNDGLTVNFTTDSDSVAPVPLPLTAGFDDIAIPALWTTSVSNKTNGIKWQATDAAGANESTGSMWANNFAGNVSINSKGTRADFITQPVSIDAGKFPYVTFDVAYAQRDSTSNDSLSVAYSLDCGTTWYTIYANGGATLKTVAPVATAYVPANGDWRQDGATVQEAAGQENVIFRFEAYSDWGNNIYVDNIDMAEFFVGINEVPKSSISMVISPNPSTGKFTANFSQALPEHSSLQVFDLLGRSVYLKQNISGTNEVIDLTGNTAGVYFAKVVSGNNSVVKKLVIQ